MDKNRQQDEEKDRQKPSSEPSLCTVSPAMYTIHSTFTILIKGFEKLNKKSWHEFGKVR